MASPDVAFEIPDQLSRYNNNNNLLNNQFRCVKIQADCEKCLADVMVLFKTTGDNCVEQKINEAYAFAQSFIITVAIVAVLTLSVKIAAIHYDTS